MLTLLRELESDQLARAKTALRVKKEEEERAAALLRAPGRTPSSPVLAPYTHVQEEVCENLRTVEFEAIQYLAGEHQPTGAQSAAAITKLVKDLAPYGLTKAEKLQIVNLAPTEAVELYVVSDFRAFLLAR